MIGFLPPTAVGQEPVGWLRISVPTQTATSTVSIGGWQGAPDPAWFTYDAPPALTETELAIEALRMRLATIRLWSRLAFAEQLRLARRLRPRPPSGQPSLPLFARRTCSQASRWMVLQ